MASVPVYGGPQVQRNRLDTPFQRPIDVSSGLTSVGRGIGDVSAVAEKVAIRDAEAEANTVDQEVTTGWLEWDAENKNKYQGANAEQYAVDAKQWWDDAQTKYGGSVTNPMVRAQIGPALGRKRNQAMAGVLGTVASTRERHADTSYAAAQAATVNFGVTTENPDGVASDIRQAAAAYGARKGFTTDQVKEEQARQIGVMHGAYIKKLTEVDPNKAQAYYNRAKERGEIPATAQAAIEKNITAEVDNQWADGWAASQRGKTYDEQLAAWEGLKESPARQKKALEQLRLNQAHREAGKREGEKAASDIAWQAAANGQRPPESVLSKMDGHDRANLENWVSDRTKRLAEGKAVKTDPGVHAGVYELARDDPDAFSRLSLIGLSEKIAPSDLEQIAKLQRDYADPAKRKNALTITQQVSAATGTLPKNQKADFQSAAQSQIISFQEEKGRPPNQSETKKILDDMLVKGVLEDNTLWFDKEEQAWRMTPEERARAVFPAATVQGTTPGGAPVVVPGTQPGAAAAQRRSSGGTVSSVSNAASAWGPQVAKAAAARGVDPGVMLAQIDTESAGNPNAIGPETRSGTAKGLTQFTDETAKQYGVNQMDPVSSINGQAAYMGDLLKKYGGDYEKALAAYNWGPGNLDKAIAARPDDWQSLLPSETLKYVATISAKSGRALSTAGRAPAGQFAVGKVYIDNSGNRAMYLGNNQWKTL